MEPKGLSVASSHGDITRVQELLDNGRDVHENMDLPLRWSALHGRLEVVRMLLDRGANLHMYSDEALRTSVENDHLEVAQLLLDRGADVQKAFKKHGLPSPLSPEMAQLLLQTAAKVNCAELVSTLMDRGTTISVPDNTLKLVMRYGRIDILRLVVDRVIARSQDDNHDIY
jgi:ankyrin repeat protein